MKSSRDISAIGKYNEDKRWAILVHVCVLANIPLLGLGLVGPLVIYTLHRKNDYVSRHARTVLNFWLTMFILVAGLLAYLWWNEGSGRDEITPLFILATVVVFQIVTSIFYGIAGIVQASRSLTIQYPLAIPFMRG